MIVYEYNDPNDPNVITGLHWYPDPPIIPPSTGDVNFYSGSYYSMGSPAPPRCALYASILADKVVRFGTTLHLSTAAILYFGDGQSMSVGNSIPGDQTSSDHYHTYPYNGTFTATLVARNANGLIQSHVYITISGASGIVQFTYLQSGLGVVFTNTSTKIGSFAWDFGDGTTSILENPEHIYPSDGNYIATLTIGGMPYSESISIASSVEMGTFVDEFGTAGTGDGQFDQPYGIATDDLFIYVADMNNHRIQIFNKTTGVFFGKFGSSGTGDGQFGQALGVAVDDTYIYTVDSNRVQIFNKTTYAFVAKFGAAGTGDVNFQPIAIAIDESFIYVSDIVNSRIKIFNKATHAFILKFGSYGSGSGQFHSQCGIAVDSNYIYVTDSDGNSVDRIQIFNKTTGAYVNKFGSYGTGDGHTDYPKGVAVDDAYIYVADAGNARVQIFDKNTLSFVSKFGVAGTNPGQFYNLFFIALGSMYIYTSEENRIQIFGNGGTMDSAVRPDALFIADVHAGPEPLTVNFTDISSGVPSSWLWEFSDGATETSQNPTHIFAAGIHTVRLTATNAYGSDSYQMTIMATITPVVEPPGTGGDVISTDVQGAIGKIGYYEVDTAANTVKIHGTTGTTLKTIGGVGDAAGQFFMPTTVSVINGRQSLDRVTIEEE